MLLRLTQLRSRCQRQRRLVAVGVAVAWSVLTQLLTGPAFAQVSMIAVPTSVANLDNLDRLHEPILRHDSQILSAQSCAAASCHGGPRPGVVSPLARRGNEYPIWLEQDPHALGWRTLCGQQSQSILRRLKIIDSSGKVVDEKGFDNCLKCHNSTPRSVERHDVAATDRSSRASIADTFFAEGVGCSACHGPGAGWIEKHYQHGFSPAEATGLGFVHLKDVFVRARVCAACHVGDRDRDMNHDIVAAGHPTLRYEFLTYHNRLPKHWRDDSASDSGDREATYWLAGQIAALDASLSLLRSRASEQLSVSRWPDLAQYDCASCHHGLGFENERDTTTENRKSTVLASHWYDAPLQWVLRDATLRHAASGDSVSRSLDAALTNVRSCIESTNGKHAEEVARSAAKARESLARWYASREGSTLRTTFTKDRLGEIVARAAGRSETFQTWESAAQFYLAAVTALDARESAAGNDQRNLAFQLRNGLRYPVDRTISRYATRRSGETLGRRDAQRLSVELAGKLAPVSHSPERLDPARPELDPDQLARQIDQLINQLESRWQNDNKQLAREVDKLRREDVQSEKKEPVDDVKSKPDIEKELRDLSQELDGPVDDQGNRHAPEND